MNWRVKALIQTSVALLPRRYSYSAYYAIQRRFGNLKAESFLAKMATVKKVIELLDKQNFALDGTTVFEVGTGRIPAMPLLFWLAGSERVITADLNPYLAESLTKDYIALITSSKNDLMEALGSRFKPDRFMTLSDLSAKHDATLEEILCAANIEYMSPADAGTTGLGDNSIDLHFSNTVYEHIDRPNLVRIMNEGRRIVKDTGLFLHHIDYSDHFSHSDASITPLNMLKYSDRLWNIIAGNRFMYCNRLRHDDFLDLYDDVGQQILDCQVNTPSELLSKIDVMKPTFDKHFQVKSNEILATLSSFIVSKSK